MSAVTINRNNLKKRLIKHVGVFQTLCTVCVCALMQVLLLPIGCGFTSQCLDIGAQDQAAAIGGRVADEL